MEFCPFLNNCNIHTQTTTCNFFGPGSNLESMIRQTSCFVIISVGTNKECLKKLTSRHAIKKFLFFDVFLLWNEQQLR